jgi:hypothetical protein
MTKLSDKQAAIFKDMRMVCQKHATAIRKRYMEYAQTCLLSFKNLYLDMLANKKQFKVTGFKINYVHGNIEFKFKDLINNVHGEVEAFPCCNVDESPSMEEDYRNTMAMYIRDDFGNMNDLWEPDDDFESRYPKYVEELKDMTKRSRKSASQVKRK